MKIMDVGSISNVQSVPSRSEVSGSDEMSVSEVSSANVVEHVAAQQAEEDNDSVINDEMLEKSIDQANKSLQQYHRYIERSVHEKTKAVMYVLKDSDTNEVIREFPPKKIQDMIAKMWELAGLFVDERA